MQLQHPPGRLLPGHAIARRGLLAAGLGLLAGGRALAQSTQLFKIATGGVSGTYFIIGSELAEALSSPTGLRPCRPEEGPCGIPGLVATAQSTAGSVANVRSLEAGEFDSGFVQADVAFLAWQGRGPFAGEPPARTLRTLASLYTESMHVVVRSESGIESIAGLRGRRVALDEAGSGTLVDARLVLEAFGIAETDLEPAFIKGGAALAKLSTGTLDAMMAVGGYPMPVVVEAVERLGCRLLPVSGPEVDELLAAYPILARSVIPAGLYKGVPETPTIAVAADWLTTATLADELGYQLTRVLFAPRTLARLAEAHPRGRQISLDRALNGLAVPLHPGAERFYRERDLLRGE